jgi:hypothetical protein
LFENSQKHLSRCRYQNKTFAQIVFENGTLFFQIKFSPKTKSAPKINEILAGRFFSVPTLFKFTQTHSNILLKTESIIIKYNLPDNQITCRSISQNKADESWRPDRFNSGSSLNSTKFKGEVRSYRTNTEILIREIAENIETIMTRAENSVTDINDNIKKEIQKFDWDSDVNSDNKR